MRFFICIVSVHNVTAINEFIILLTVMIWLYFALVSTTIYNYANATSGITANMRTGRPLQLTLPVLSLGITS